MSASSAEPHAFPLVTDLYGDDRAKQCPFFIFIFTFLASLTYHGLRTRRGSSLAQHSFCGLASRSGDGAGPPEPWVLGAEVARALHVPALWVGGRRQEEDDVSRLDWGRRWWYPQCFEAQRGPIL